MPENRSIRPTTNAGILTAVERFAMKRVTIADFPAGFKKSEPEASFISVWKKAIERLKFP
jgi:hypothetical protein